MMKRVYVLLGVSGLYGLNRFLLLPSLRILAKSAQPAELLYRGLASYGADVLAGMWILCFLNLLLVWSGRKPIRRTVPAVLFVLGCGMFWEYITPLYLNRAVSDYLDVAAYLVGGGVYLLMEKHMNGEENYETKVAEVSTVHRQRCCNPDPGNQFDCSGKADSAED